MSDDPFEADDLQAAELAFGLLDAPDRRMAETRLSMDDSFAALYRPWAERAAALLDGPDAPAPAQAWEAIRRGLPANDTGLEAAVRRWKAATVITSAAAGGLAFWVVALLHRPTPTPLPPPTSPVAQPRPQPLVALLSGKGAARVALWFDRSSGRVTLVPASLDPGAGSVELWVIPAGGKPRSLGVIAVDPATAAPPAAAAPLLAPGATIAVSREPKGGSPTGQPTGPVILTGPLIAS